VPQRSPSTSAIWVSVASSRRLAGFTAAVRMGITMAACANALFVSSCHAVGTQRYRDSRDGTLGAQSCKLRTAFRLSIKTECTANSCWHHRQRLNERDVIFWRIASSRQRLLTASNPDLDVDACRLGISQDRQFRLLGEGDDRIELT